MARHPGSARAAGVIAAAALLLATATPTVADTQLGSSGRTGPHALRDRASLAGATCSYIGGVLDTIVVRAPRMRARDVSGARDHQSVRWSIRVDYWDVNLFWATASAAGPWTATAWDDQAATFVKRSIPAPTGLGGEYRVVIVMRWLRNGHVEGRSTHLVDWVRVTDGATSHLDGPAGSCPEMLAP